MPTPASVSSVWSRKALWNTTVGLRSFWLSLVALPLPLQSYCQGNGECAACHLVHYHTAMVSGSRESCYLVSQNNFLSPSGRDSPPSVHSGTLIPFPEWSRFGTCHETAWHWHQWLEEHIFSNSKFVCLFKIKPKVFFSSLRDECISDNGSWLDDDSSICLCLVYFPSWLYCHLVIPGKYTTVWHVSNRLSNAKHITVNKSVYWLVLPAGDNNKSGLCGEQRLTDVINY